MRNLQPDLKAWIARTRRWLKERRRWNRRHPVSATYGGAVGSPLSRYALCVVTDERQYHADPMVSAPPKWWEVCKCTDDLSYICEAHAWYACQGLAARLPVPLQSEAEVIERILGRKPAYPHQPDAAESYEWLEDGVWYRRRFDEEITPEQVKGPPSVEVKLTVQEEAK